MAQTWLLESVMPGFISDADLDESGTVELNDIVILVEKWLTDDNRDENYYYHYDGLGSVVALSDEAGNTTETYSYDVYGQANNTSSIGNPYLFTGRRFDAETDLYYYRARMYSSATGCFLQTDPVGYADGTHLYRYVRNNPTNFIDPSGMWLGWDDAIFAGVGTVGGLIGQGLGDLISGELSTWESYVGAAAGGAAAGETLLYTGNPWAAGAAGGAVGNLTKQGLENLTGTSSGFDWGDFLFETGSGTLTGGISGNIKIPGINSGRNSYAAITKQIITKLSNGTIKNVSSKTLLKIATVPLVEELFSAERIKDFAKNWWPNK